MQTARALAAAVRAGDADPVALVDEALERLGEDPRRGVRAGRARGPPQARSRRGGDGPLQGVPVGVKDLYDVAGQVSRASSEVPAGPPAAADSPAVARLRAAGAVVLGRTRTHEFAWGITTQHPRRGGARNPRDLDPRARRVERRLGGRGRRRRRAARARHRHRRLDPAACRLVRAGRAQADARERPARRRRAAGAVPGHRRRAGARRRRRPARARGAERVGAGAARTRCAGLRLGRRRRRGRRRRGSSRPPAGRRRRARGAATAPARSRAGCRPSTPPCRGPRRWPGTARTGRWPRARRRATAPTSGRCSSAARA